MKGRAGREQIRGRRIVIWGVVYSVLRMAIGL